MTLHEKIKWINKGMALQKRITENGKSEQNDCCACSYYEAFKDMLASGKQLYCGNRDQVEFFKQIIYTLGLGEFIEYKIEHIDNQYKITLGGKEE